MAELYAVRSLCSYINDSTWCCFEAARRYYLGTGIWPLVQRRSFEAITGRKQDFWLEEFRPLLDAPLPAGADAELVISRVDEAIRIFRSRGSTKAERRQAVRELVDVLEALRSDIKEEMLPKDEGELSASPTGSRSATTTESSAATATTRSGSAGRTGSTSPRSAPSCGCARSSATPRRSRTPRTTRTPLGCAAARSAAHTAGQPREVVESPRRAVPVLRRLLVAGELMQSPA